MKSLSTLPRIHGAHVVIRVDYNVPLKGNKIVDSRRIEASYKTIDTILKKGGTPILIAHLGDSNATLRPIATFLSKKYNIVFITNDIREDRTKDIIASVPPKTVILLENIRRYQEEESNVPVFAKRLASFGEYYVNDAFSVSHRKHASVVGIPKYVQSFAGYQLELEIQALSAVLEAKKHPFIFILGGAKFGTKIPLLKRFGESADQLIITGAILNNFYKLTGFEIGNSVVEEGYDTQIKKILKNPKVLLPIDVLVVRTENGKDKKVVLTPNEVQKGDVIVDIGPQSVVLITEKIKKAKLVVWNGPTGWYEKGFTKATLALAGAIVQSKTTAVIGGGDTGAVIEKAIDEKNKKRIFISTGGGATLEFLSQGTLPGISVLS